MDHLLKIYDLVNPSNIETRIDKIKLKSSAHQKLSTINPGMIKSASNIISALITNKKSPSVNTVMGMVKTINKGFKVALNKAKSAATRIAVKKFSTKTPGSK